MHHTFRTLTAFLVTSIILASCQLLNVGSNTEPPPVVTVPDGFVAEYLYSPSVQDQGTWVALTWDDQGRLIATDQHGKLYRMTIPAIGESVKGLKADSLDLDIGMANGLLWAFNSLYVVVNNEEGLGGHSSGIYRVTDSNGDDNLDNIETLHQFEGWGEHGPHSLILSPDGEQLYFIAGNHTDLPESYQSLHPPVWDEDQLLPAIVDPRGHANDRMAPGGWIARMNPDGSDLTVVSVGYRNAFDIAFNEQGDLFTFDADMEWDMGMPWYRPVRVNHATSGSAYGWRTGAGKFPAYYPDNLPAVVDIGQGSPTGVLFGGGSKFPTRYQTGLFVYDWSFGTAYFVDLMNEGSSYTASHEEFLSGIPLPLTDGIWGADGAMYFAVGGRNLDSHLYRVYYNGTESTAPPPPPGEPSEDTKTRLMLEAFHSTKDLSAVNTAWPYLNHSDRFIQHAARIAIENQPVGHWKLRVFVEPDDIRRIHAVIALARHGAPADQSDAFQALSSIDPTTLSHAQQMDLVRAYALVFIRLGEATDAQKTKVAELFSPLYPAQVFDAGPGEITTDMMNREIGRLLAYVEAPGTIEKTLTLMETYGGNDQGVVPILSDEVTARHDRYGADIEEMKASMPTAQEINYARSLSIISEGWTLAQREQYFQWFFDALSRKGGRSYKSFIDNIRTSALAHVPESEQEALADLVVEFTQQSVDLANLPQPVGPGKNYTMRELNVILNDFYDDHDKDFENGRQMYAATLCLACHTMGDEGGNVGPDLTQVGTRFSKRAMIEAIVSPSDAISDQYEATIISKTDGTQVIGRILSRDENNVMVNQNPFDPSQSISIAVADIEKEEPSPASIMPAGLVNRLNPEEFMDLIAYMAAGGDPNHEEYRAMSEE